MIENRELYPFEETNESVDSVTPESSKTETEMENIETGPPKFLYQSIVAVLCLVITISLCRSEQVWGYWLREKLHYAINASSESTFGVIWNLESIQDIVRNVNNLVRLEKVTQTLSDQTRPIDNHLVFEDSVWPIAGNIAQEFIGSGPFGSGVIMETTGQARVIAIAAGEISRISQIPGGWIVEIDHDYGWISIYQPITQLQIQLKQRIEAGQIIGRVGIFGKNEQNKLFLEIKHNGQPVNPRTIIR